MDSSTSSLVTTILSSVFQFMTNIYTSAKERKFNCGCLGCEAKYK